MVEYRVAIGYHDYGIRLLTVQLERGFFFFEISTPADPFMGDLRTRGSLSYRVLHLTHKEHVIELFRRQERNCKRH
jgi:hypothetical protein